MSKSFNYKDIEDKIDYFKKFSDLTNKIKAESKITEDIEKAKNILSDDILYQIEKSFLLNELIFEIGFIKKYYEDVTDKINDFYEEVKNVINYKRKFLIVDEEIKEVEDGYLATKREEFLNSPQFQQLKKLFEDSSLN